MVSVVPLQGTSISRPGLPAGASVGRPRQDRLLPELKEPLRTQCGLSQKPPGQKVTHRFPWSLIAGPI